MNLKVFPDYRQKQSTKLSARLFNQMFSRACLKTKVVYYCMKAKHNLDD